MNVTGSSTDQWEEAYQVQLNRVRVLEGNNEALREDVDFWKQQYANILKDAERYRFIRNGGVNLINFVSEDPDIPVDVWAGTDRFTADTLDEAIDAARKEGSSGPTPAHGAKSVSRQGGPTMSTPITDALAAREFVPDGVWVKHARGLERENAALRSLLREAIREHVDPYDLPEGDDYIARVKIALGEDKP